MIVPLESGALERTRLMLPYRKLLSPDPESQMSPPLQQVPPAWHLRPGCAGLVLGVVAPPLEFRRVQALISAKSGWYIVEMWSPAQIESKGPECGALCLAPGGDESSAAHEIRRSAVALVAGHGLPLTCYATPAEMNASIELLTRLGASSVTPVMRDLQRTRLQDAILESVLRPFFQHVGAVIASSDVLVPELRFLLHEVVTRELPYVDQAEALIQTGSPPFVRHVTDVPSLIPRGRSYICGKARAACVPLGPILVQNTALHGLARYEPDRTRKKHLAVRLGYSSSEAMEKALRRAAGVGLKAALSTKLGDHAERLLHLMPDAQ